MDDTRDGRWSWLGELAPGDAGDGVGVQVRVALRSAGNATSIRSASYDPVLGMVGLVLADGRGLLLELGKHIEDAEEWS